MQQTGLNEYEIYALTDTGLVRAENEDHILALRVIKNQGYLKLTVSDDDDYVARYGLLLAVADGIGGAAAGGTASRVTLNTLDREFSESTKNGDIEVYKTRIKMAIDTANRRVQDASQKNKKDFDGMGCTLTGVCLGPQGYIVFNIGDSRVYRARNGVLRLLTRDDTVAQRRADRGNPAESQEQFEIDNRTLTSSIGRRDAAPALERGPALRTDDVLLVCSDGVHDLVAEKTIGSILADNDLPMADAGQRLMQHALDNGGRDNISLILLKVRERATSGASEPPLGEGASSDADGDQHCRQAHEPGAVDAGAFAGVDPEAVGSDGTAESADDDSAIQALKTRSNTTSGNQNGLESAADPQELDTMKDSEDTRNGPD